MKLSLFTVIYYAVRIVDNKSIIIIQFQFVTWLIFMLAFSYIPYKEKGAGAQVLQNVIRITDLIEGTLIADDKNLTSFSVFRKFIGKH